MRACEPCTQQVDLRAILLVTYPCEPLLTDWYGDPLTSPVINLRRLSL